MNKDIIYREDAIKAFTFNSKGERIPFVDCDNFPVEFPLRYIVDTLAALPSADRPQGEWLKFGLGRGTRILFCTNCERKIEVPLSQGDSNYDFCPNCGARMKG